MIPPSNRLEKLNGNFKDLYSIRINDQWRIIFEWNNGNAEQVPVVDYHYKSCENGYIEKYSSRRNIVRGISFASRN